MSWIHLPLLPEEPYPLAQEAADLRLEINARIAAVLSARSKLDSDRERLSSTSPTTLDAQNMKIAQTLPARSLEILRDEIRVRQSIDSDWRQVRHEARAAQSHLSFEKHAQAQKDVTAKLVSIGYINGVIPDINVLSIIPDMIARHPDVFRAKQARDSAAQFVNEIFDLQENAEALARVEREFATRMQRLAAG